MEEPVLQGSADVAEYGAAAIEPPPVRTTSVLLSVGDEERGMDTAPGVEWPSRFEPQAGYRQPINWPYRFWNFSLYPLRFVLSPIPAFLQIHPLLWERPVGFVTAAFVPPPVPEKKVSLVTRILWKTRVFNGQAERLRDLMTRRNEQLDAALLYRFALQNAVTFAPGEFSSSENPEAFLISGEQAEILSV
jgi:hypothetical protein